MKKWIIFLILSFELFLSIKSYAENCFYEAGKGHILIAIGSGYGIIAKGELFITDPIGRKVGLNITTGAVLKEIPCASYSRESIGNLETGEIGIDENRIEIVATVAEVAPMDGLYKLVVIGTSSGYYGLDIYGTDIMEQESKQLLDGTTYPGKIDNYEITYSSAPGSQVQVAYVGSSEIPVFDGKGQRPTDVNKFLQYFNPTQTRIELPAGTQSFNLSIIYGNTIKRETFGSVLNGTDITSQFDPLHGKMEIVKIPLSQGSNTLVLSVKGLKADGREGEDTDRLTFIVP